MLGRLDLLHGERRLAGADAVRGEKPQRTDMAKTKKGVTRQRWVYFAPWIWFAAWVCFAAGLWALWTNIAPGRYF
jgi:hypothetical protein